MVSIDVYGVYVHLFLTCPHKQTVKMSSDVESSPIVYIKMD